MNQKSLHWLGVFLSILFISSTASSQTPFQVTNETADVSSFAWSPTSTQFVFTAACDNVIKLHRIDLNGTNKTTLTSDILLNPGSIDWKGSVIVFKGKVGSGLYENVIKRINPDGTNETTIMGPYWYGETVLKPDGNYVLFRRAPNGWWEAKRCDLNGGNVLTLSHQALVHGIGWLGNSYVLYTRGANYYTPCRLYKVSFNGGPVQELTPNDLPGYADFSGSPDLSKILYCDGTNLNKDIWIMNADGTNKKQLTTDPKSDELSPPLQNVWTLDSKSFFFYSLRSGKGDIYQMNIDGTGLTRITFSDSVDFMPNLSPDGKKLAFLSNRDGHFNIWVIDFEKIHVMIPDTTEDANKFIDIPVRVTDVTNKQIYSYGMTVETNPAILVPQGAITTGTLSAAWGNATTKIEGGKMKVAIAGSTPLSGSGTLIYLRYKIPPDVAHNAKTLITISDFIFNDGQPQVVIHHGSLTVIRKYDVSGDIKYYSNKIPIPGVKVSLDGNSMTTGNSGEFKFNNVIYGNYTLRPTKTGSSSHAVGPYDAALILLHSVQSIKLTPYQMIAGDVSGKNGVTSYDASLVLQYYVGLISSFPIGKDWKFVPVSFPINDLNWHIAPDTIRYEPLRADTTDQNFLGIVYGDVSGNWSVPAVTQMIVQSMTQPQIVLGSLQQDKNGGYMLPLTLSNATDVISLGLTCQYNPNQVQFLKAELTPVSPAQPLFLYHDQEGIVKIGLASARALGEKNTVIKLFFKAIHSMEKITSHSFSIPEFTINNQVYQLAADREIDHLESIIPDQFELSQNYPNPFNAETVIHYQLPRSGVVTISIYNLLGQKIRTLVAENKQPGYHQVIWDGKNDANEMVGSGEYLCHLRVGEFVALRKLLLIR